jgi:hypothetical protein
VLEVGDGKTKTKAWGTKDLGFIPIEAPLFRDHRQVILSHLTEIFPDTTQAVLEVGDGKTKTKAWGTKDLGFIPINPPFLGITER